MRKEIALQELLGLKQQEMAMILNVTRSQWSMSVLGKRDLPIQATLKLAQIVNFMNQPDDVVQQELETSREKKPKSKNFMKTKKS